VSPSSSPSRRLRVRDVAGSAFLVRRRISGLRNEQRGSDAHDARSAQFRMAVDNTFDDVYHSHCFKIAGRVRSVGRDRPGGSTETRLHELRGSKTGANVSSVIGKSLGRREKMPSAASSDAPLVTPEHVGPRRGRQAGIRLAN
jgi:hypothetical protein